MARRRRRSLRPWILLALIAGAAYGAWRYGPSLMHRLGGGTPAPAVTPLAACVLADPTEVAAALGIGAVDAQASVPAAGVPATGGCTWAFGGIGAARGRATVLLFTRESLAAGGATASAADYFRSSVTGLEYAWKDAPRTLSGIGDEAVIAGFDAGSPRAGAILVRRGERVIDLGIDGADAAAAQRLAAALATRL
jgi:hypothetical protein